ncbi:MAG: hypothetical protein IPN42_07050 [Methylococcaceae bacterium]|nr:hypothetical protein [Methylococcaceae bacterium]
MNDSKQMISVRLVESDRIAIKAIANRLLIRESDVYRFAVNYFLSRFDCLGNPDYQGSDLLLPFCEIRHELLQTLSMKKHLLERIFNNSAVNPDKYVAMSDIELLLLPSHLLRQRLLKLHPNPATVMKDHIGVDQYLKEYFIYKYDLDELNQDNPQNPAFSEIMPNSN